MLPSIYILLKEALVLLRSLREGSSERDKVTTALFALSCLSAETRHFCKRYSAEFTYYLESCRVFDAIFDGNRNVLGELRAPRAITVRGGRAASLRKC
jgi:hypothetical protein